MESCFGTRAHRSIRRAMTLADVMLAVTLMGILAAIATPKFAESLDGYRTRSASLALAGDLNFLRNQAMVKGRDVEVVLSVSACTIDAASIAMPQRPGRTFQDDLAQRFSIRSMTIAGWNGNAFRFDRHGECWVGNTRITSWSIDVTTGNSSSRVNITSNGALSEETT